MIRIHQTFGAHAGRVLEFRQEVVRFGRQPSCDVAFDPHADIDSSGRHAEIRWGAGGYTLIDSGSRNGTFVNGSRIQQTVLRSGDEIEFGAGGPRVRVELLVTAPQSGVQAAGYAAPPIAPQEPFAPSPGFGSPMPEPTPITAPPPPMGQPIGVPVVPGALGASSGPVGVKTVGVMIQAALDRDRAARAAATPWKIAVVVLTLFLMLAMCIVGFLVYRSLHLLPAG